MGALPKRRISTARQGKRRSVIKLKRPTLVACLNCQQLKKPHQACPHCHEYKDTPLVNKTPEAPTGKKEKKVK